MEEEGEVAVASWTEGAAEEEETAKAALGLMTVLLLEVLSGAGVANAAVAA